MNCMILIYPKFCLLQDILTKDIIGRRTKRGGLYYMDDFSVGRAHLAHGSAEQQIWVASSVRPPFIQLYETFVSYFIHYLVTY